MNWQIKRFNELSPDELYQIMALRLEVFVVEQNCVYQDADGKDHEALHLFASENGSITAYCRIFGPGIYFEDSSIGRVIVKESFRGSGLGHELMKRAIQIIKSRFGNGIRISAQEYLLEFYRSHGFEPVGEGYLEDGIPHIAMVRI